MLGPMTRYADATTVTVWLEASGPCVAEVRCAGRRWGTSTFEVEGHHYALVVVDGLAPGTDAPYAVALDGRELWPDCAGWPGSRLRTRAPHAPLGVAFGSCRVDRPHHAPWTLEPGVDPRGVGVDALTALADGCARQERALPDLLLLLGDQVYADEGLAPQLRLRQVLRRGPDSEPRGEVADFEEYTWLYRHAWEDAGVRWLLSTVPSVMVFDDHDVRDDWNTSRAWQEQMAREEWWAERLTGAYMAYWLYQHLGNQSPAALGEDGLLAALQQPGSRGEALRDVAARAGDEVDGHRASRWSHVHELGTARLVVVDSRSGRVLGPGRRAMLSEPEWQSLEHHLRGDCDHLLVATTLPLLLERPVHDLQGWNEVVAGGAWGPRAARWGERLRQALDLEHWAAFRDSFDRLVHRLGEVGAGRLGAAPSTVLVLSGDVHHSYLAPVAYPSDRGVESAVVQLVSSPLRNAVPRRLQRAFGFARSRSARLAGRLLAASAGVPPPAVSWSATSPPLHGNTVATLRLDGTAAEVTIERAERGDGRGVLRPVHRQRLDRHRADTRPVHGDVRGGA